MIRALIVAAALGLAGCTLNVIVPPPPIVRAAPAPPPPRAKLVNPCGIAGMINCNRPDTRKIV